MVKKKKQEDDEADAEGNDIRLKKRPVPGGGEKRGGSKKFKGKHKK
jgi:hypothetical protein